MSSNSTLELSSRSLPKDLVITSQPDSVDKDKFKVVASGLQVDKSYAFQFQYVFTDGTTSEWSPGYFTSGVTESVPGAPTVSVVGGAGFIQVSLPTFPSNASRVDVRIAGGIFGDGTKVADSFSAAGTKTIAAPGSASPGLAYVVTLLTVTPSKINGDPSSPVTVYVTDPAASIAVDPSVTPSTPTVSSVLGAIQLSWNGKTSTGGNQPAGFDAAKVYVGTTAGFTPVDTGNAGANQVDILNFANGQNTLNIAVGTVVNGTALTYGTDYYIKIKTTNGNIAQDSTAVSATGNPVQIGKVGSGDIVSITADQITTGTISSQIVTVGTTAGKHVKLSGTGDPLTIYGTGGTSDPLLSFGTNAQNESVLTIKGNGTFSGALSAATGSFAGNITASNGLFSVNNGVLTAQSGTIGGWNITGSVLESSAISSNKITLNPATPKISLIYGGVEKITIDPVEGIKDSGGNFILSPAGTLTLKGSFSLTGYEQYNNWSGSQFQAGTANAFLSVGATTGTTVIYSADTTQDSTDGNSSTIPVPQKIEVTSSSITIQGLPGVGNGLTAIGNLIGLSSGAADEYITRYWSSAIYGQGIPGREPSSNYGSPARYRMIVADPYDYNKLKRGFGVYYGVRNSGQAPSSTTGFVGDLWVSW
jgi:hypothetical protein